MTPLNSERDAAIGILITECGITPDETAETRDLWELVFINNLCFAGQFKDNIFNSGKPWKVTLNEIHRAHSIAQLKQIYQQHTKLQTHPQFLAELTGRKKRILRQ